MQHPQLPDLGLGAHSDDPTSPATAGLGFLRRVKSLLGDALDKSRITTVQALLLLSSSLGALGEYGSGWMYSGIGEAYFALYGSASRLTKLHDTIS
jgi:hypothetical protein